MQLPSITLILSTIFVVYIAYSVWTLSQLFTTLKCSTIPCYTSILTTNPKLQLVLFTSVQNNPLSKDVTKITSIGNFDYRNEFER